MRRALPWTLVLGCATCSAAYAMIWRSTAGTVPAASRDSLGLVVLGSATALVFAVVGALIVSRRSRNAIGWLFLAAALSLAIKGATEAYTTRAHWALHDHAAWYHAIAWLSNWVWIPGVGAFAVYLFLLYPTGRLPSPRWRPVGWLGSLAVAAAVLSVSIVPGPLDEFPYVRNPVVVPKPLATVASALSVGWLLLGISAAFGVVSIVVRARRAGPVERAQIKWIAFAGAFFGVGFVYSVVFTSQSSVLAFGEAAAIFGPMCGIAIACAVAIQRYRLFDIDRIVSRTVSYSIVSGLLVGVYLGLVLAFNQVMRISSAPAIAASTLTVALLFGPLRRRVQSVVDRRFNRARYDAQRTLDAFGRRLRSEIDLQALSAELCSVTRETVQPTHVGLWLRTG